MAKNNRDFVVQDEEPEQNNPAGSPELAEAIREMSRELKGLRSDVAKVATSAARSDNPPADPDPADENREPLTTDQVKAFLESKEGKSMLAGSAHLEASKGKRAVNIFRRLPELRKDLEDLNVDRGAFTEKGRGELIRDRKLAGALEREREELQAELDGILAELPEPVEPEKKKDKWSRPKAEEEWSI